MTRRFRLAILSILILFIYLYVNYPLSYLNYIMENAEKYNVDPYLIASVINVESRYNSEAISKEGAVGLMQIMPETALWISEEISCEEFTLEDLKKPNVNIQLGSWYLSRLSKEFNNNIENVLAAYNGGSGNVRSWLSDKNYSDDGIKLNKIPFEETENYIVRVEKNYIIYSNIYRVFFNTETNKNNNYIGLVHGVKNRFKEFLK